MNAAVVLESLYTCISDRKPLTANVLPLQHHGLAGQDLSCTRLQRDVADLIARAAWRRCSSCGAGQEGVRGPADLTRHLTDLHPANQNRDALAATSKGLQLTRGLLSYIDDPGSTDILLTSMRALCAHLTPAESDAAKPAPARTKVLPPAQLPA